MPFKYSEVYDNNKEKIIHPRWLNLPINKAKYILKGLIDTDGSKGKELTFDNTSRNIIESMRYLFLKMGVLTSGYIRDRVGESHVSKYGSLIENKKISYTLRIPKTEEVSDLVDIEPGNFFKFFKYNNYLFTRIIDIQQDYYSGTLYDLQMRDTHNYMIHNGIVHNGGGKRNGSFAIYLEPWHADIESFLDLKKNHGDEEMRARDLFYALWIPGLFMEKMKANEDWHLFCPDKCPGLSDVYGEQFKELYEKYVAEEKYNKVIKARDLWFKILDSQMETGTPYLLFKDACNEKSNQKNLGTIKSSNLCTEIVEYSDDKETAVCNLASIGLSKFVRNKTISEMFSSSLQVYTKTECKWCTLLKELLKEKNIAYEEILVEEKDYEKFKEQHNVSTFPQVYDGEKLIGGYDNTSKIINEKIFDYDKLQEVVKVMVQNLNNIININYYPNDKTRRSNLCHRPIGLGVQGLADTFILMDLSYESAQAQKINKNIFETIYYAALEKSYEISKNRGQKLKTLFEFLRKENIEFVSNEPHEQKLTKDLNEYEDKSYLELYEELQPIYAEKKLEFSCTGAYSSFTNSPASLGTLQFDMWNVTPELISLEKWNTLKQNIIKFGLRNSLLVAPMPTASTSQILGNNECFEPFTSNIYTRRTLAGEFICVNKYLIKELTDLGLWNEQVKNNIIANKGSVQYIDGLDEKIKEKYKIVWEIQQKQMINMARDRGAFICQSQSLNLWMEDPNYNMLTKMHYYSYSQGLKTGIYYLRRKPKHQPQQFTIEPENIKNNIQEEEEDEICEMCSA